MMTFVAFSEMFQQEYIPISHNIKKHYQVRKIILIILLQYKVLLGNLGSWHIIMASGP